MAFKFESLIIWQRAFELTDEIHNLALTFPKNELFSLLPKSKEPEIRLY